MHRIEQSFEFNVKATVSKVKTIYKLPILFRHVSCQYVHHFPPGFICQGLASIVFIHYAFPTRFLCKNGIHQLQTKSKTI